MEKMIVWSQRFVFLLVNYQEMPKAAINEVKADEVW